MLWLLLACRNLMVNRRRSLLALGSVAAAAAAMMLFANYVNAIRVGLRYTTIHNDLGHLRVAGRDGFDSYEQKQLEHGLTPAQQKTLTEAADRIPAIRRIVPSLDFQGLISNGPRTLSFGGTGVDPVLENTAFGTSHNIIAGRQLNGSAPDDGVILGVELAKRLGMHPGQSVTLLTSTVSGAINAADVQVIGLENTGSPERDLHLLRAKMLMVQSLLATDKVSDAGVLLQRDDQVDAVAAQLAKGMPDVEVRTWRQLAPYYDQVLRLYENLFQVFGVFILVVSLLGLTTIILTSVLERSREIGVMRALGISELRVRGSFVLEGVVLCGFGVGLGIMVAAGLGHMINSLHVMMPPPPGRSEGYPLKVLWDWASTGQIALAVLLLGVIAAWIASGRVTRLKVIEALGAL